MRVDVAASKDQADALMPEIKRITGEFLIATAPPEEDMQRNTDLTTLIVGSGRGILRVACRVRSLDQLDRYGRQFTIRSGRPNGVITELTKLVGGWGDYLFYGFGDATIGGFAKWFIGDLCVFRRWYAGELYRGRHPGQPCENRDGSSTFLAFDLDDMPPDFIIAASWLL